MTAETSLDRGRLRRALLTGVALKNAAAEADGVSPAQVGDTGHGKRIGSYHSTMSDAAKRPDDDRDGRGNERIVPGDSGEGR